MNKKIDQQQRIIDFFKNKFNVSDSTINRISALEFDNIQNIQITALEKSSVSANYSQLFADIKYIARLFGLDIKNVDVGATIIRFFLEIHGKTYADLIDYIYIAKNSTYISAVSNTREIKKPNSN